MVFQKPDEFVSRIKGNGSEEFIQTTDTLAVLPAPTNVTVTSTTARSVSLSWDSVIDPDNPNGQVKDYVVNYYPVGSPELSQSFTTLNYLPQATLSGLLPSTEYSFNVIAESIVGAGNQSEPSDMVSGTTASALSQNSWDLPAAIFADPLELGLSDLTNYLSNLLSVKKIFLEYVSDSALPSPLSGYVDAIQSDLNGEVILSFGRLEPLIETTSQDIEEIIAFYEDKVSNLNLNYIDFALGFDLLYQPQAINKHIAALYALLQNHLTLKVSYTVPVLAVSSPDGTIVVTGLEGAAISFLGNLRDAGITPSLVNVKPNELYGSLTGDIADDVEASIEGSGSGGESDIGLKAQLKEIFNIGDAAAYQMIGIDPKFGENSNGLVFNLVNQAELIAYKTLNNISNLNGRDISIDMNLSSSIGSPFSFSQLLTALNTLPLNELKIEENDLKVEDAENSLDENIPLNELKIEDNLNIVGENA